MVLATGGAGFAGPAPLPDLPGRDLYKGPNMHSASYRNASELVAAGAKVSSDNKYLRGVDEEVWSRC